MVLLLIGSAVVVVASEVVLVDSVVAYGLIVAIIAAVLVQDLLLAMV